MTAEETTLLQQTAAECYADPLRFVHQMYPWGVEHTPLAQHDGPDTWQTDFLLELGEQVAARGFRVGHGPVDPIRMVTSSGHGVGKSVLVAWIVDWIMGTRANCQGTITANTFTQMQTKTWAAVQRWNKLCYIGWWFVMNQEVMFYPGYKESWFAALQSSKEHNSEAFAGQHAADSTSFYIADEASTIPDTIHEVIEGGLTDGEPMVFLFGNPTKSSGAFHRACFGTNRNRWTQTIVDARTSKFTNKKLHAEWLADYGEDSDFFRVRVRGLPPRASDLQFIDTDRVSAAQRREVFAVDDDPLIAGLDVARGGADNNVIRFRRGRDARSIKAIKIPGEFTRDSMKLVARVAEVLVTPYDGRLIDTMFIDGTGIGGPICDRLKQLGHQNVVEIQFGSDSPNLKYANMRAYMWAMGKEWLLVGGIDEDPRLETDLTGPGYHHDKSDRVVLESKESMKKREVDSPDDGDALMLTFAIPVLPKTVTPAYTPPLPSGEHGWMA